MRSLALPLLSLLAISPFVHARLEENLPASTYGLVKVESVTKTRKNLETNPFTTALKAPKFADYLKPLVEKMRADPGSASFAEFEKQYDALLETFTGEVVFAVVKTPDAVAGHLPYDYILLADTAADEARVNELLKKLGVHQPVSSETTAPSPAKPAGATPMGDEDDDEGEPISSKGSRPRPVVPEVFSGEEVHHGVTLHTLSVKMDDKPVVLSGWAIVGKTLVYATAPNVLRDLVDARREGRKDNFTDQAVYKTNRESLENSDAWALFNLPLIAGTLREKVVEESKGPDGETKPGIMGMNTLKAYDSLGLDALEHLRVSVTLKPDDTRSDTSLAWSENRGLIRFITDSAPKDAVPDLTVMPAGVMTAGAARMDVSKFFARLESMLKEALPLAAPMFDMQVDRIKKEESLDLRSALLENFGDEIWSFSDPLPPLDEKKAAPTMAPSVFVITLKDENKFNSFVETLAGKAAPQTGDGAKSLFEERELLGVKVRSIKNLPPTTPRIQYAITKGKIFLSLGDGKLLDRTLAQFNDPKGGLAADPSFKEGLAKLPKGGSSVGYYDLGEYFSTIGKAFVAGVNQAADRLHDADKPKFDASKAPVAADLPFVAVSSGILLEKEITSRTVIVRKPDAK
jgi:hypothetical protein